MSLSTQPAAAALAPPSQAAVETAGRRLIAALPRSGRNPLDAGYAFGMEVVSGDPELRAALFRLVDVAPTCRTLDDLGLHLDALLGEIAAPSRPVRGARRLARGLRGRGALGLAARVGVRTMASRFIAGSDAEGARAELGRLWRSGAASTVDLLGEATVTEAEADLYAARCGATLATLADAAARWPASPRHAADLHGPLPRANLSVKVSALTPHGHPHAPHRGASGAADRLRELMRQARDLGAHLHVDMESLDLRETVTELVFALLEEPEFRDGPSAGMVLQGYLRDAPEELDRWLAWARASGRRSPLTVRLVKGAYWDHELVQARQAGWPVPVFDTRAACDRTFELLTRRLLAERELVRVAVASHNLRSIAHAQACAEASGASGELELQVLRGLGDDVQHALAATGARVRAYCPVGDLVAGMAYLVRRLLENTSNDSFLRARATASDLDELLRAP
jgi:proline dehydrogenase